MSSMLPHGSTPAKTCASLFHRRVQALIMDLWFRLRVHRRLVVRRLDEWGKEARIGLPDAWGQVPQLTKGHTMKTLRCSDSALIAVAQDVVDRWRIRPNGTFLEAISN